MNAGILSGGGGGTPTQIALAGGSAVVNSDGSITMTALVAGLGLTGLLAVTPSETIASAAGSVWNGVKVPATTLTISGSTHITTAAGVNLVSIAAPTLSAGSALTVDKAATLTILGPPAGGGAGPVTITTPQNLGLCRQS